MSDAKSGSAAGPVLRFDAGTLCLRGVARNASGVPHGFAWDPRDGGAHRAPAFLYGDVIGALRTAFPDLDDAARRDEPIDEGPIAHREPRPFQREALQAWQRAERRGVVVLPTGAGKTHVATMAIVDVKRSTLVVAPTLDLVRQWYDLLRATFGGEIGVVGGGDHDVRPLTVTTYDSAYLHMDRLGARFGLVVFDECHHLPGPTYAHAARLSLAPHRLGLTATPEREDGRDAEIESLVGPIVYRRTIGELSGEWLADYDVERVSIELAPDERAEHDAERSVYLAFIAKNGIRFSSPRGFSDFIVRSSRSSEGRRAMRAYRRQRALAFTARAKLAYLAHLLDRHANDRAIVFTQDNATAYEIARRFLVPVITHQTKVKERSEILAGLRDGSYGAVVTSKVLNEGVDVRAANVAVVLSGSGSVREHVQRLGRVLRKEGDKRAILYELVTAKTGETYTSQRRREHDAWR